VIDQILGHAGPAPLHRPGPFTIRLPRQTTKMAGQRIIDKTTIAWRKDCSNCESSEGE
jgi:hypothetical protein